MILSREEGCNLLRECRCFERMCRHYGGFGRVQDVCIAFPKGIPDEIITGENEHLMALPEQINGIIYERASRYVEMEMFKPKW
jgi:hypothetical protein